jgi:saccharopine dehydrogenase-like NADP-dependent oxidoreductase
MKHILVLGAGKSATVLIEHLLSEAWRQDWHIDVADIDPALAARKVGGHLRGTAHGLVSGGTEAFSPLVGGADLVISLLPPPLHPQVAALCLREGRHFLNASYLTPELREMDADVRARGLTFLCECGLDPGIDHMSAMRLLHDIRSSGGRPLSFRSHCGGLLAPTSDDNPWHYKFSWNPRNVIMAGRDGAVYRQDGRVVRVGYGELFDPARSVDIPGLGNYAWYPNRDSLPYLDTYGLEDIPTFVRTTLRHPDFCFGWKNLVALRLTDDTIHYDTDGMSLSSFFQIHFDRFGFSEWLDQTLSHRLHDTRLHLEELISLMEADSVRAEEDRHKDDFMLVNGEGDLRSMSVSRTRSHAAHGMANRMHEARLVLSQLFFLGLDSGEMIDGGRMSAADILQWTMERRMALRPEDRDMVVMMHEVEYEAGGNRHRRRSTLTLEGEDAVHTAMAKTVGMPLAIAAGLILSGRLAVPGVQIPVLPAIYDAVLPELESHGIGFREDHQQLSGD